MLQNKTSDNKSGLISFVTKCNYQSSVWSGMQTDLVIGNVVSLFGDANQTIFGMLIRSMCLSIKDLILGYRSPDK